MKRFRITASVLVLAALAGCSDLFSPSAKSRLDENRDKWRAQTGSGFYPSTYTFTLNQICFCAINGPVRVVVSNASAVTATQISTGQALDTRFVLTIEALFDFIERGIANHSAVLEVTYDPVRGYPVRIVSDGSRNAVDDEVTYEVSDVSPVVTAK
jgi:uncharacterized protein DUF6174